jgi:hypothetical protein
MIALILSALALFISSSPPTTDVLIESGVCGFFDGYIPYELHSNYVDFLPSETVYNVSSFSEIFSNNCPNSGSGFALNMPIIRCTLNPNGTTFTVAKINANYIDADVYTTANLKGKFQPDILENSGFQGSSMINCMPKTVRLGTFGLFSTGVNGIRISAFLSFNQSVTTLKVVEKFRILLPST